MEVNDSYRELGITHDCSDAEVKAAWRRMAARWHPDRNDNPAALRKIQRINRALEEIRKARRMSEADPAVATGESDRSSPAGEGAAPPGGGSARTLHHRVGLTLEQACAGCVMDIQGEVIDDCSACGASGVEPQPRACVTCGGTGQTRQSLWFGWLSTPTDCGDCNGLGERREACAGCQGTGKAAPRRYRVRVRIPAGMRDGGQLHVPARTRARAAGRSEALTLSIALLPHAFFTLDDDGTVRCEVPVDGFAWMAERWTEVPTPSGLQQMRLRRGHLVYRIKGQGFPGAGGGARADCLVTVAPLFPEALDDAQEVLVERLIATHSGNAATPAGRRLSAWQQALTGWEQASPPEEGRRDAA